MNTSALLNRLLAAWRERALVLKAMSFAAVGVVNSAIDFGVFWVAVQYFGAPLVPANVLSWLVAVSNSYVLNSFVTFAREFEPRAALPNHSTPSSSAPASPA